MITINEDQDEAKIKLRYRIQCMRERLTETQDRITSLSEQKHECCSVVLMDLEPMTMDGEAVTME